MLSSVKATQGLGGVWAPAESRGPSSVIQQCSHGRTSARVWRPYRPGCPRLLLGPGPQHQGGCRTYFPLVWVLASRTWVQRGSRSPGSASPAGAGFEGPLLHLCQPWTGRSGLGRGLMVSDGESVKGFLFWGCFEVCNPACSNFLIWER